jgi:alpha(1,3/1,4) fucosyltransferase
MKVKFVDFWPGFDPHDNFLLEHLKHVGDFTTDDEPDVIFFSCYGVEHRRFATPRVFYSAENQRPDFTGCDFAITLDYNSHPHHFRYPLFAVYSDIYDWWHVLTRQQSDAALRESWKSKSKFCCMVVSNGESWRRLDFFDKLSSVKRVDSGGRFRNNVGGPVPDKLKFIKDYRFVISFENSSHPGYTTEKLVEPLVTGCIPIYWGNPELGREFNTNRFLVAKGSHSDDQLIETIIAIDENPELALTYLREPVFPNNQRPSELSAEQLRAFLAMVTTKCGTITPVATIPRMRAAHLIKRKFNTLIYYVKQRMNLHFR